jgi:ribosomal-protein-serine acetyltransferase
MEAGRPLAPDTLPLTPTVEMRLLVPDQAEAIFATVERNRAHLRQWLPWVDPSTEAAHTRSFIEQHVKLRDEGLSFAYSFWEAGQVLGMIGVHDIAPPLCCAAIGYWLAESAQGRGIITQAVPRLLHICYDTFELERVEIRCAAGNQPSAAVPERLGFTYEGTLRHGQLLHGAFVDLRLYSLLRGEFYSASASRAS